MKKNKNLYHKYITGNCDDSEKEKILEELQRLNMDDDSPEELSRYDGDIDPELSSRLLANIQYKTTEKRKIRKRRILRTTAGIMGIALIFGFVHFFKNEPNIVKPDTFLENKITVYNHADTISILNLPDNSIVRLAPNSSISYKAAFEGSRRNVYLDGTAIFKVSKDAARPFNVYSGAVVTTAIGTVFKVAESGANILIKLLEGKIVVKKNVAAAKAHYLLAGNAINYNVGNGVFTSILNTANAQKAIPDRIKLETAKKEIKSKPLNLNNVPMADALDKIAQRYNVEIEYSPSDVENINIIASLNHMQPVKRILQNIALMNQLNLLELDNGEFIIEKKN